MCFHCEDTGLLEIQILLCFTTAYLQVDPEKMDHIKHSTFLGGNWGYTSDLNAQFNLKLSDQKFTSYLG